MGIANSTLILHPDGHSDITFDTLTPSGSSGHYVNTRSLVLNEGEREEIFYSGGPNVDGGQFISSHGPLVPVTFQCIVWAATRAAAVTLGQTLKQAVTNEKGGTLEYKPEEITTRSTFYHYVKSGVPRLVDAPANLWDGKTKFEQVEQEIYALAFEVELMTLPAATSDPDNLVALSLSDSTLDNTHDPGFYSNYFDITGSDIKGDLPAHLLFQLENVQTADYQKIGRVYLTTRSSYYSVLLNLAQVYEAESASVISQSLFWSTQSDGTRSNSSYELCNPSTEANNQEQILRFAIANETQHRGRMAVMACLKAASGNYDVWEVSARYRAANGTISQSTPSTNLETWGSWHLVYCGELDFPPTDIDDSESISPTIDLVLKRTSGYINDTIAVDFIALLFLDEPTMQFDINAGFDEDERLFNRIPEAGGRIAHIVNASTLAINRAVDKHYGDAGLLARPGFDTRVFTFVEHVGSMLALIDEDFEDYEGEYWWLLGDFESDEDWQQASVYDMSTYDAIAEGSQSIGYDYPASGGAGLYIEDQDIDITLIGEIVFVCVVFYIDDSADLTDMYVRLYDGDNGAPDYYTYSYIASISTGNNYLYAHLDDDFSVVLDPDNTLETLRVNATVTASSTFKWDYLRFEREDPDDNTRPNVTGTAWDFQPDSGSWTITKDGPSGSSYAVLACLDNESGVEKVAWRDLTLPDDVRGYCKVAVITDAGQAGLAFRVADATAGSEDLYAFMIDWDNDEVNIYEYTAGAQGTLATAASQTVAADTWYWLAFTAQGSTFNLYLSTSAPTGANEAEKLASLTVGTNKVFSVTDATISSGKFGLMSIGAISRFDDVYVEGADDRHVPTDQVTVSASALFRTIYPFPD